MLALDNADIYTALPMGSFIDTLGRLTEEQSRRIAKESRQHELEQQRLAMEEMDRLHQEDVLKARELEALEQRMSVRSETLNMAWLGANLLKAAEVRTQNWVDLAPEYKTKGLFRKRQHLVGRQERYAFDAWGLDEIKTVSTVQRDFYAFQQSELVLGTDGTMGIAQRQRYMEGAPKTILDYMIQKLQQRRTQGLFSDTLSDDETAELEKQYLASNELHEHNTLSLLSPYCSGEEEQFIRTAYSKGGLDEDDPRFIKVLDSLTLPVSHLLLDRRDKIGAVIDTATERISQALEDRSERKRQTFNVDKHLRQALATLLASNGIKIN